MRKTKPDKVVVNAGATVEVTIDGKTHRYGCSGTNEKTGGTPAAVIKNLKDCIEQVAQGKAPRRKK